VPAMIFKTADDNDNGHKDHQVDGSLTEGCGCEIVDVSYKSIGSSHEAGIQIENDVAHDQYFKEGENGGYKPQAEGFDIGQNIDGFYAPV
jgi:hypothetical protein